MEITYHSERRTKHNSRSCRVAEYLEAEGAVDIAVAHIKGREPEFGWAVNAVCTEVVYVSNGSGYVELEGDVFHHIHTGDVIRIKPGEKFFWQGELTLVIACSPSWYAKQYSVTD